MEQRIFTSDALEELKRHGDAGFPFQTYDALYKNCPMESMTLLAP